MENSKYKGHLANISPEWEDVNLFLITESTSDFRKNAKSSPLFLFIYENDIYIGICDYKFHFLENFDDFTLDNQITFNSFFPGKMEFDYLKGMNPTFYKLDYQETLKGDLDEFSEYELDLLKEWNRELSIIKLLS